MSGLKVFIKRFQRLPKRKQAILSLFLGVITVGIGLFIWATVTGRITPFATGNDITNFATVTWMDASNIQHTATSNTVATTVENPTGLSVTVNLRLQGRSGPPVNYATTGTKIYFYTPETTTVIDSKTDVATDTQGIATINLSSLTAGNYDVQIDVNSYLKKTLRNTAVAEGTILNFGQLLAGDLFDDGIVDGSDWTIMSGQWRSTSGGASDFNRDGIVDGGDWSILSPNWRQTDN